MSWRLLAGAAVIVAGTDIGTPPKQTAVVSTEDGVYTAEQAGRGRISYETNCQRCHGVNLSGAAARQLTGEAFIADWANVDLDRLFERVRTMPPGNSPRLPDDEYLAIVAYILEGNRFPAGDRPMGVDNVKGVVIAAGAAPPDSGLVQFVGCLQRGIDGRWLVSGAGDPVRTKDPNASTEEARMRLADRPAGSRTVRLLNVFPSPDRFEGHRVEAKGLLIRGPEDSLNVTAVETIAPRCPP